MIDQACRVGVAKDAMPWSLALVAKFMRTPFHRPRRLHHVRS